MSNARNIGDSAPVINFLDGVTSDIQTQLNTLDTAIGNVSVTSGSLTKTFAADEVASITLTGNVLAPVVTATKEVAQTGVTNNAWDAAAASYTLENSAPSTTLDFIGYKLSDTTYDSISFSVGSQDTSMRDLVMSSDGTKLFTVGEVNDSVYEYALSTAYDVSSASYTDSFSVSSQENAPQGLAFSPDGLRFYVCGGGGNTVFQYSMSTAWDISTASYVASGTSISTPLGLTFNPSGTSVYVVASTTLWQYDLSTAWDITTASYVSQSNVSAEDSAMKSIDFNSDGSKVFLLGDTNDKVFQYSLSTAYDASTDSYDSVSVAVASTPNGISFGNSGTKLYVINQVAGIVYQYSVGIDSVGLGSGSFASSDVGKTIEANSGKLVLTSTGGAFTETTALSSYNQVASGSWQMYALVYDSTADVLKPSQYIQGYQVTSAAYDSNTVNIGAKSSSGEGLYVKADGSKFYVIDNTYDKVFEYDMSTPDDLTTASFVGEVSVYAQEWNAKGVFFKPDGLSMYIIGKTNPSTSLQFIQQYTLSTAWDITTATYASKYINVSGSDNDPQDLWISSDGTLVFWIGTQSKGGTTGRLYKWTMSTAWDISTAVATQSINIDGYEQYPMGIALAADGKSFYTIGTQYDTITGWYLSTAFDLSTAGAGTAAGYLSTSAQDMEPRGLAFNGDGSKLFTSGTSNTSIFRYSTGSSSTATGYQPAIASTIDSTYWTDINSMTATNSVGDGNVFYALSADAKTSWNILSNGTGATFVVTVAGGKFVIDGVSQDSLTLQEGQTYIFDQADATNGTHPLRLSTTSDGTHGGGTEYTTGVTTAGTAGSSGAYTQIVVAAGAPTLYYYCSNHSGMGGTITIGVTGVRKIVKNNGGTYQVNTNSTYGSETWANAATNTEAAALREAMTSASAESGQYDLSTATLVDSYTGVNNEDTSPYGLCFSATGHKMYISGIAQDAIFEYDLSTNFDVSTASYTANYGVVAQDNSPNAVEFNNDGTKMYVAGDQNNSIYEYALSTAWSVISATYTTFFKHCKLWK